MDRAVLPLLDRYTPEMLLVSLGFDTHWIDPLGQLQLSVQVQGELMAALTAWADRNCAGKIAVILEGGYDLDACEAGSAATAAALLGEPWSDPLGPAPLSESTRWKASLERTLQLLELA